MTIRTTARDTETLRHSRQAVAANIRWLRRLNRFSQASLGTLVEMSQSEIGRIERGERSLQVEVLDRLAAALGVAPWELLIPRDEARK